MAPPANRGLVIAAAVILGVAGIALQPVRAQPSDRFLSVVALSNTSLAFVLAFWALARWSQFSVSGRLVVAITVAGSLGLAVAELLGTLEEEPASRART